ncbi:MAG: hypothetical protein PHY48_03535 [Candidatus Cloacimonetes bacterium]|nr:hypothetical protein [Candidatus Cloacimonadota bacterium]
MNRSLIDKFIKWLFKASKIFAPLQALPYHCPPNALHMGNEWAMIEQFKQVGSLIRCCQDVGSLSCD